jgi:predicted phage terminase large subunit-like protein
MKSINQRLAEVDYSFKGYNPSIEAMMFVDFIKEVNKNNGGEEHKTPMVHLKMLDLIFRKDCNRKAIMCSRGLAKTSLAAEYGFLYAACYNEYLGLKDINVAMYVASSLERGAKDLRRNIEQRYANSEFLQQAIPNKKFSATDTTSKYQMPLSDNDIADLANAGRNITDVRIEFVNIDKKPFCVRLFGITSGIRGFKEYGKRPNIAVIDDVISDQDARSDAVIRTVEDTIYKAVTYALHPTKNQILFIGTPFNSKDPLYKAIESDAWKSVVFPICEKYPCEPNEFRGAWEDRFPYSWVKQTHEASIAGGTEQGFRQEIMLQIIPEEGLLVQQEDIIEIPSETFKDKDKNYYNFYITTDFAYTDKESSDYSVISVWAVNSNGEYILCDGYCGKQLMDRNIDLLFRLVQQYQPIQVGFELTGQQIGFVQILRNEMIKRNIYFTLQEIRPSKDKFSRFNLISPYFKQKKILITSNMMKSSWGNEFTDEISKATIEGFKSKHDDVLDTISQLMDLNVFAPSPHLPKDDIFSSKKVYSSKGSTIF